MKQFLNTYLLVLFGLLLLPLPQGLSIVAGCAMMLVAAAVITVLCYLMPGVRRRYGMNFNGVTVTLANGQLGGTLQTNDGIVGLVTHGVSEAGGYTLATPILINGMSDLANAGITVTNNPFAYKQVKEFYDEGGEGASLYLMLVATTLTIANMADKTVPGGAIKLLNFADGKIKVLGLLSDDVQFATDGGTVTVTAGMNAACATAATNLKALATDFFNAAKPFRGIIGVSSYSGTASALADQTAGSNNRVAMLVGDTVSGAGACIGLLLGRISKIPVQRMVSRRRDGALIASTAFYNTTALASTGADRLTIAGKGYITWLTRPNRTGFYFSGDPMLVPTTDDYCTLARGRVIDKVHILAFATLDEEVDNEIDVDGDTGNIDPGYAKWLEQQVVNAIELTMLGNKEISKVECYINPVQNVISTNTLNVVLKIVPKGYSKTINLLLAYKNPALSA